MRSIRAGKFLQALIREEINQDNLWVVRLRTLPDTPETFYLTELMASNDFQTALQNYLDLEDLHRRLLVWQDSFGAFEDLIRLRRANLQTLLPQGGSTLPGIGSPIRPRLGERGNMHERRPYHIAAPRPRGVAAPPEPP